MVEVWSVLFLLDPSTVCSWVGTCNHSDNDFITNTTASGINSNVNEKTTSSISYIIQSSALSRCLIFVAALAFVTAVGVVAFAVKPLDPKPHLLKGSVVRRKSLFQSFADRVLAPVDVEKKNDQCHTLFEDKDTHLSYHGSECSSSGGSGSNMHNNGKKCEMIIISSTRCEV